MQRFLAILRWATAVALLLALFLLAWQCIDIYVDGNTAENLDANGVHIVDVFRMEDIAKRIQALRIPLVCCAVLTIISLIMHTVGPEHSKYHQHRISHDSQLRLLKRQVTVIPSNAMKEERKRILIYTVSAMVLGICTAMCLVYFLQKDNFASWDLELVMTEMLVHVGPWIGIGLLTSIIHVYLCGISVKKEVRILQSEKSAKQSEPAPKKGSHVNLVRTILYVTAVVFILLGVMNGGLRDVLVKAINICTECIGLG